MKGNHPKRLPPRAAIGLLERFCQPERYEEIRGDLEEVYQDRLARMHPRWAGLLYVVEVLFFFRAHVRQRPTPYEQARGPIMWKNYLKIALRTVRRQKSYAFINLTGLTLGIASCLLILLFIQDELSYDRFHTHAEELYRVTHEIRGQHSVSRVAGSPGLLAPVIQKELPEVMQTARISRPILGTKLVSIQLPHRRKLPGTRIRFSTSKTQRKSTGLSLTARSMTALNSTRLSRASKTMYDGLIGTVPM